MVAARLNDFHGRISRCAQRCQDSAQDTLGSGASEKDASRAQVGCNTWHLHFCPCARHSVSVAMHAFVLSDMDAACLPLQPH